jgi:hypothetical protein
MSISREGEKERRGSQSEDRGGKRRKCKDSRARWRCCLQVVWFSVVIRQFSFEGRTVSLGVLEFSFEVLKLSVEVFTVGCEVLYLSLEVVVSSRELFKFSREVLKFGVAA